MSQSGPPISECYFTQSAGDDKERGRKKKVIRQERGKNKINLNWMKQQEFPFQGVVSRGTGGGIDRLVIPFLFCFSVSRRK